MKTEEIIRGNVFIIPNSAFKFEGSLMQEDGFDLSFGGNLENLYTHIKYSLPEEKQKEFPSFKDEYFVEVWFVTPNGNNDSNWVDHYIDGYEELDGWRPATRNLPASLFKGKKEGDTVTFDLPIEKYDSKNEMTTTTYIKVSLVLKQKGYRYERFGKFEDVLARVCRN